MSDDNDPDAPSSRWTCEACGCHTNTEANNSASCGICGTRRVLSHPSGRLRRGLWGIGGLADNNYDDDDDIDMEEDDDVDSEVEHSDEDVLNGNRAPNLRRRASDMLSVSDRLSMALNPSRELGRTQAEAQENSSVNSNELFNGAVANGNLFQPYWSSLHCSSSIKVEDDSRQVACVFELGSNANCVRSSVPIPSSVTSHMDLASDMPAADSPPSLIGWRITFEPSARDHGRNADGPCIVGVVTEEFSDFSSRNGLQHSRFFWGVEDNGRKYEGGTRGVAEAISFRNASRISDSVLFASKEILTLALDVESGTIYLWKDSRFLGAVVSGVPKSKNCYPVAAMFSQGGCVAITGLTSCPSTIITEYLRAQQKQKDLKNELFRDVLKKRRNTLLTDGSLSADLKATLQVIWTWYSELQTDLVESDSISSISAARLWYRSGLKFSRLCKLLDRKKKQKNESEHACDISMFLDVTYECFQLNPKVEFTDYLEEIQNVVDEEEEKTGFNRSEVSVEPNGDEKSSDSSFRVGDKVEITDGSNRYGDASNGPLKPGDLGTVIELQRGARGDRQSVRVLFNGRRWWYQPHALISERSGLIEPLSVRFLVDLLRSHGYDSNLVPLWGKPVTAESWKVGDLVIISEKIDTRRGEVLNEAIPTVGVISEVSLLHRRESRTVHIDLPTGETKRFNVSSLVHTTFHHMHSALEGLDSVSTVKPEAKSIALHTRRKTVVHESREEKENINSDDPNTSATANRKKLSPFMMLDKPTLKGLMNDCKRKSTLARLFSAGLSDSIFSAIELAHDGSVDASSLASLGALCVAVCQQLFGHVANEKTSCESDESASDSLPEETEVPDDNNAFDSIFSNSGSLRSIQSTLARGQGPLIASNAVDLRELVRDLGIGADQRRSVLLALMASERMHFEPRQSARSSSAGAEDTSDRMRYSLSPFARLNAEAALGLPISVNSEENVLSSLYSSNRLGNLGEQGNAAGLIRAQLAPKRLAARKKSPSAKAFIYNGLLLNNVEWVKKYIASGVESKMQDEEGNSVLLIAICLGCSTSVINVLVDAGFVVGYKEIQLAAYSNQVESLALILNQAVLNEGMVDLARCSSAVADVIEAAMKKQQLQEKEMLDSAKHFGSSLLWKFVDLTLSLYIEGSDSQASCCMNTLVGDVLLHAVCSVQNEASTTTHDTSDSTRAVVSNTSLLSSLDVKTGQKADVSLGSTLIEILPSEVIVLSLTNNEALFAFLRLMEMHLWNKDINQATVGLILAECLLKKCPSLRSAFFRYGLRELFNIHISNASESLFSIEQASLQPHVLTENPIVCCPKGHVTAVHLTRHSSFKCDLCGKGVEQGKPMHGCRECDWDACEKCTDKAEGGFVKWTFVKNLAQECLEFLPSYTAEDTVGVDELHRIAEGLKRRDHLSVIALGQLLDTPGRITLHEFTTHILPALHFSLLSSLDREDSETAAGKLFGAGHRKKKIRISSIRSHSRVSALIHPEKNSRSANYDIDPFISSLMSLLSSSKKSKEQLILVETVPELENLVDEEDEPEDNVTSRDVSPKKSSNSNSVPRLLYMLHTSLAFHERLPVSRHVPLESEGELQPLLSVIELELTNSQEQVKASLQEVGTKILSCCQLQKTTVCAEVLLPISELYIQIIRSCGIRVPSYTRYCKQLVQDRAILLDMGSSSGKTITKPMMWRVFQIVAFDEITCAHNVRYASNLLSGADYVLEPNSQFDIDSLRFDGREAKLVIAARNYYVLRRFKPPDNETLSAQLETRDPMLTSPLGDDFTDAELAAVLLPGTRVECDLHSPDGYTLYTIISVHAKGKFVQDRRHSHKEKPATTADSLVHYTVVSDGGEILEGIVGKNIRSYDAMISERRGKYKRRYALKDDSSGMSNIVAGSRGNNSRQRGTSSSSRFERGTLKRSWSALSTKQNMRPLELCVSKDEQCEDSSLRKSTLNYNSVEHPPTIMIDLYHQDDLSAVASRHAAKLTLFSTLNRMFKNTNRTIDVLRGKRCSMTYAIDVQWRHDHGKRDEELPLAEPALSAVPWIKRRWNESASTDENELRFTTASSNADSHDCDHESLCLPELSVSMRGCCIKVQSALESCDGLNSVSIQCLKVVNILADIYLGGKVNFQTIPGSMKKFSRYSTSPNVSHDTMDRNKDEKAGNSIFVSEALTKKLLDQLEDPLSVVSGALPEWCSIVPSFASFVFSHTSRRLLLDRAGFGVSRAVFCQQESKVNVGPLRQRMASLRARAVELVTEAFSHDADDPTALQLQADELYGMEEALNARVAAQFRAQGWTEHALESAKAVIRRDHLLSDAALVMDRYSCDVLLNRRRLEVRFEGESGFDAASGDEAGVTRGFYADVAEALLSCDHIAGVQSPTPCPSMTQLVDDCSSGNDDILSSHKLPLWIPDVDPSHKVIIPTPRAHADASLGVYPRPLGHNHPMRSSVLKEFRFIGRLFAAAIRDRFIFPLPLSISFLKLVQSRSFMEDSMLSSVIDSLSQYAISTSCTSTMPDYNHSMSSSTPAMYVDSGDRFPSQQSSSSRGMCSTLCLDSADLPRPGFLGGEVYAVENFICAALDNLEESEPHLTKEEMRRRRREIASDKSFSRKALGKSYDCSFEEYFEERTFVDPLDPLQGGDAWPLCPNGAQIPVTIDNVRVWVTLAKQFVLHDGVVAQADAFRQGINDFFSADALLLLTPRELYEDVCGGGDNVDSWDEDSIRSLFKLDGGKGAAEALVAVAALGGDGGASLSRRFGPSSPTIGYLTKSLLEATSNQRRQFLSFVTSVPIVTPGKIEVVPLVSPSGEFLPMRDPGCMPRANTCARRLYLPKFESYAVFKQVFYSVLKEESRFKGFYEWRG